VALEAEERKSVMIISEAGGGYPRAELMLWQLLGLLSEAAGCFHLSVWFQHVPVSPG